MGETSAEVVETGRAVDHRHTLTHQFLLRIGCAEIIELLAPLVYLVAEVQLNWADGLTGQAECASRDVAAVLLWVAKHAKVNADGAWDEIAVAVST